MSEDSKNITPEFSEQEVDAALEMLSHFRVPEGNRSKEDAWNSLFDTIEQQRVVVSTPGATIHRLWWVAAAASILLIVGFASFFYFTAEVSLTTGAAQHLAVVLPDGSHVTLNAESSITYPRFTWSRNRVVNLSGEAMFSVTTGKTFTVDVDGYSVQVLGTVFNVRYRDKLLDVKCYEGVVAVASSGTNRKLVKEGHAVSVTSGEPIPEPVEIEESPESNWTTGDFYFEGALLTSVFEEIQRQFGVEVISSNDFTSRTYTGYFNRESLPSALEMVCIPMGLSWSIAPDSSSVKIQQQDQLE